VSILNSIVSPGAALITYIVPFLVALIVIVFIHELGHFLVARFFGVSVETFSVGFGKVLYQRKDRYGTDWKFCLLPFGGYVKFEGDANGASFPADSANNSAPGNFHGKPVWQRALVVAAGPIANFLLAITIFAGAYSFYGVPNFAPRIDEVQAGSAADVAGLKAGDFIRAINGKSMDNFGDVQSFVRVHPNEELVLEVERGGSFTTIRATPKSVEQSDNFGGTIAMGVLGFSRDKNEPLLFKKLGPIEAIGEGVDETWNIVATTMRYLGKMVTGEVSSRMIGGPVMIAKGAGDSAKSGFVSFVAFIAFISVSIGLVNLFPVPMLDGGHLVFYAIEAVRGKPLGPKAQEWGFRIGLSFVLFLMLFGTTNDILRWISFSMKS
jgi:regulator of sigma E protease